jgi:uncharacterized membrane protein YkvA (DUF1232 family)
MVKRLPAYLKLAWALIKEPAIPWRHKLPLYSVPIYEISPPHLLIAAVPVLGQIDSILLLLIALRHALSHCPPLVVERHLWALNLTSAQITADCSTIRETAQGMCGSRLRSVNGRLRFAGRVARGFTNRRIARWSIDPA